MLPYSTSTRTRTLPDRIGLWVSASCGIHCAAMALVFILYPSLWLNHSLWELGVWQQLLRLERLLLALAWLLALLAMSTAIINQRRFVPPALALVGLAMLSTAILSPLHAHPFAGSALALIGGLFLATAHGINLHHQRTRSKRLDRCAPGIDSNQFSAPS